MSDYGKIGEAMCSAFVLLIAVVFCMSLPAAYFFSKIGMWAFGEVAALESVLAAVLVSIFGGVFMALAVGCVGLFVGIFCMFIAEIFRGDR